MKTKTLRINPSRPLEELLGVNRGIVRQKLGRVHCMTDWREAYRDIRRGIIDRAGVDAWRDYPLALRRGLAKCVHDTLAEFRGTYVAVMSGNFSEED